MSQPPITALGIDADTERLAVATVTDGRVVAVRTIPRAKPAGPVNALYDGEVMLLFSEAAKHDVPVYLEGTFLALYGQAATTRNAQTHATLNEVQGELKAAARRTGAKLVVVSANEWRAGSHGVTKPTAECKRAALLFVQRLGYKRDVTEHEAEACGIAWYGWSLTEATARMVAAQRRV